MQFLWNAAENPAKEIAYDSYDDITNDSLIYHFKKYHLEGDYGSRKVMISSSHGVDLQEMIQYELRDPSKFRNIMRKNTRGNRMRASSSTRYNESTQFIKY